MNKDRTGKVLVLSTKIYYIHSEIIKILVEVDFKKS